MEVTTIREWCQQHTFFVTGGTGFMGKALIFKLLKSGTSKIFLLVRSKKGVEPEERIEAILRHEIFQELVAQDPNIRSKLVAVIGDTTINGLGMSPEDRQLLQEEVNVVFHVAASVKFDDSLKFAVNCNLRPTRDVVELAKGIKNLKMFHYVSTAFCNYERMLETDGVEERVYERKMNWRKLIEFVENNPDDVINAVEAKLLGALPNTYLFTKHLTEAVIEDAAHDIPVVITRPPIIIPGWREPIPGWMDNISSPTAIIGACGKGLLRVYFGTGEANKAYLPVDVATNCIIGATWLHTQDNIEKPMDDVPVYNMDSYPMTTALLKKRCFALLGTNPTHNPIWYTHFYTVQNRHLFLICFFLLHLIPALLVDLLLKLSGRKPMLLRIYRKTYVALVMLLPLLNSSDQFKINNYKHLAKVIPEEEKEDFILEVLESEELIQKYLKDCDRGFRTLIGDPKYPSEQDFVQQRRLFWIDRIFCGLMVIFFFWIFPFQTIFSLITSLGESFVSFIAGV